MVGEARQTSGAEATTSGQNEGSRDDEPLIEGEDASSATSRFKQVFKGFFRGFRTCRNEPRSEEAQPTDQPAPSLHHSDGPDVEVAGLQRESSAQSLTPENRETRLSEVLVAQGNAQEGLHRNASSHSLGRRSPRRSTDSPGPSNAGLLNNLLRLGEAAIPQPQRNSSVNPTCLICLEPLSPEEFASGEAIILDCECRGDVAMRHRCCVEKWTHVKGNRTCDICKTLIKNLPDPPPRAPETASSNGQMFDDGEMLRNNAQFIVDQAPTGTDVVFDCIRVTWIAMIISILFFGMDIANALWTGAIVGLLYTICVRAMYQYQLRMYMRDQQRERDVEEGQAHTVVVV